MKKLKKLLKKYEEIILYLLIGGLTTLVSLGTYYLLVITILDPKNAIELQIANIISWICSVTFAYFTNRKIVFNSTASNAKEKLLEFGKFILGRAFTMIVELVGFFLMFNVIGLKELVSKILISIIVIILNFFISKFFAFKK